MLAIVKASHTNYKDNVRNLNRNLNDDYSDPLLSQPFKDISVEKLYAQRDWKRWFYPNWDGAEPEPGKKRRRVGTKDTTFVKEFHGIFQCRRFDLRLDRQVSLVSRCDSVEY